MTDQPGTAEPVPAPSRAGQVNAVLAAALAEVLLFLPILLVGFRFYWWQRSPEAKALAGNRSLR